MNPVQVFTRSEIFGGRCDHTNLYVFFTEGDGQAMQK
jgi:hypothetical protein